MKKSFHSPLSRLLREAHAAATESAATGAPIDEVTAWRAERRALLPRRQFLAGAATAALVAPRRRARASTLPSVVIMGGGLAGLSCARALWQNDGIAAQIYEWDNRIGGRVQTLRGYFAGGITVEEHGQLISSEHSLMRGLAATYGLRLANTNANLGANTNDTGWYGGQRYTAAALAADWQKFACKLFRDAYKAAPSATYLKANAQARAWDNLSVTDWVNQYVPGGTASPLGALCLADVISEYGSPPELQSALNLIYILGEDASRANGLQPRNYPVVAGTDEKYQVAGGNDQIITGLAGDLPAGTINLGYRLLAVRETSAKTYISTFQVGNATVDVKSDHVVLTLPPTTLRDVDLSGVSLSPLQKLCIASATLGNNAKIFIQVAGVPWQKAGYDGTMLTDQLVCGGWDASNTQTSGYGHGAKAIFCGFPGGAPGTSLAARYGLTYGNESTPAPAAMVTDTLAQVEPIFPGITAGWDKGPRLAYVCDGNIDPHLRGAYSNFLVGQYTSLCGAQSLRAGNLHFAGEHTSVEYQGYMEGAVQSGLRAAVEI